MNGDWYIISLYIVQVHVYLSCHYILKCFWGISKMESAQVKPLDLVKSNLTTVQTLDQFFKSDWRHLATGVFLGVVLYGNTWLRIDVKVQISYSWGPQ